MVSRSLNPILEEMFAHAYSKRLQTITERASAAPFADLSKSLARLQTATAPQFADLSKSLARLQTATAPQFADLSKSLARLQTATAPQFADLSKSLARLQTATAPQFADLSKSLARLQTATAPQFADLSKSLAKLQRSSQPPVPRQWFTNPVSGVIDRVPEVISLADAAIADGTRFWQLQFDFLVTDGGLREACRNLFMDGYHAEAVRNAFTYFDNLVRNKSGQAEKDGADLMRTAFSVNNPILRFNDLKSRSDRNEQQGYMEMCAGAMIGIRNPRSHEHNFVDDPEEALEMLVLANHLVRKVHKTAFN